jgi:hypothetical protein
MGDGVVPPFTPPSGSTLLGFWTPVVIWARGFTLIQVGFIRCFIRHGLICHNFLIYSLTRCLWKYLIRIYKVLLAA